MGDLIDLEERRRARDQVRLFQAALLVAFGFAAWWFLCRSTDNCVE